MIFQCTFIQEQSLWLHLWQNGYKNLVVVYTIYILQNPKIGEKFKSKIFENISFWIVSFKLLKSL